jgi:hypothetical protein
MDRSPERLKEVARLASEATADLPATIRPAVAAAMVQSLLGGVRPAGDQRTADRDSVSIESAAATGLTLGETLAKSQITTHPERILAVAAFAFEHGNESVTAEELLAAYNDLRIPKPQNLSANLGKCVKRGWLVPAPPREGRKSWRITQTGMKAYRKLEPNS